VQHVGLVLVEDVQGTNRQDCKEKRRRHLSGVECRRMQERQMVVEQVKVGLEQTVQCVEAGQVERLEKRVLAVVLLDILVNAYALLLRVQLGRSRHGESLAGARRLAVVDRRHGSQHRGVRRQGARRSQAVAAVHGREGGGQGVTARHCALHQRRQLVGVRAEGARAGEGRVRVWLRLGLWLRHHRVSPWHLRQHVLARGRVGHDGLHHGGAGGRDDRLGVVGDHLGLLAGHGAVVEVGHEHGGGLDVGVDHVLLVVVHVGMGMGMGVGEGGRVEGHGWLRGARVGGLVGSAALLLAGQRGAAIFCVYGAVVAQEEVAAHKGAAALEALEGPLFGVCGEGQLATPCLWSPRSAPTARCPAAVNSYPAHNIKLHRETREWKHLRERSWRLRCSLRLKARLQNWHLYFFSGAPVLRAAAGAALLAMGAVGVAGVVGAVEAVCGRCSCSEMSRRLARGVLTGRGRGCGGGWTIAALLSHSAKFARR
jgi:hypothetical protein